MITPRKSTYDLEILLGAGPADAALTTDTSVLPSRDSARSKQKASQYLGQIREARRKVTCTAQVSGSNYHLGDSVSRSVGVLKYILSSMF